MKLLLPSHLAINYTSKSQQARVMTEAWAEQNILCLNCGAPIRSLKANAKTTDFVCTKCPERYQLKSGQSRFRRSFIGADYQATIGSVRSGTHPSLLLLQYDGHSKAIIRIEAIHRSWISQSSVRPRNPLSSTAERKHWKGCVYRLDALPSTARVPLVEAGTERPAAAVRRHWATARSIARWRPEAKGWIADTVRVVNTLADVFTLPDVYDLERDLARLHPHNKHIRAKLRQQLQVMRDMGLLRFLGSGRYQKTSTLKLTEAA